MGQEVHRVYSQVEGILIKTGIKEHLEVLKNLLSIM